MRLLLALFLYQHLVPFRYFDLIFLERDSDAHSALSLFEELALLASVVVVVHVVTKSTSEHGQLLDALQVLIPEYAKESLVNNSWITY